MLFQTAIFYTWIDMNSQWPCIFALTFWLLHFFLLFTPYCTLYINFKSGFIYILFVFFNHFKHQFLLLQLIRENKMWLFDASSSFYLLLLNPLDECQWMYCHIRSYWNNIAQHQWQQRHLPEQHLKKSIPKKVWLCVIVCYWLLLILALYSCVFMTN